MPGSCIACATVLRPSDRIARAPSHPAMLGVSCRDLTVLRRYAEVAFYPLEVPGVLPRLLGYLRAETSRAICWFVDLSDYRTLKHPDHAGSSSSTRGGLPSGSHTDLLCVKNRRFSLSGVTAGSKKPFEAHRMPPKVVFIGFVVSYPNVHVSTMKSKQFSVANPMLILPASSCDWARLNTTVHGKNPAPVDGWFIPLNGFQPSKVVQDFFHPQEYNIGFVIGLIPFILIGVKL